MVNGDHPAEACVVGEVKGPPPKAMVKPQVLTHVIEGFVIQEASEPFAVSRSSLLNDLDIEALDKEALLEPPKKKHTSDQINLPPPASKSGELWAKCEFCGKVDLRAKFKKAKRFCSLACAKSKRVAMFKSNGTTDPPKKEVKDSWPKSGGKDWVPPAQGEGAPGTDTDTNDSAGSEGSRGSEGGGSVSSEGGPQPSAEHEDSSAPESPAIRPNPIKWTVSDVCEFISALPGCSDYVEDFAIQEIDGQALMLLKEDHLMQAMSMKLGPALKICAKIDTMRADKEKV